MWTERRSFEIMIETFIDEFGHKPRMHNVVCPECDGNGRHATPSLRDHAFTQDEIYEMGEEWYEFQENYRNGFYDVPCDRCERRNVVEEIDYDCLTTEERKMIDDWISGDIEAKAVERAERMMGC